MKINLSIFEIGRPFLWLVYLWQLVTINNCIISLKVVKYAQITKNSELKPPFIGVIEVK